ncbi:Serine/threonine-protein kinase dclk3 [Geranomyces michiganensis]|nr:Serine/threonine-protein kinase dclk3 [Geranomyces michiganensis]
MSVEERSKRIRVFRNGDVYDRGRRLVINPRVYRNFEQFLSRLSKDLNLTNGAARRVFALATGQPVVSLDDLTDNGIYIASAGDALKRIAYLVDPSATGGSLAAPPVATHEPPGRRIWHAATVVPRRVFKQGVLEAGTSGEELRDREHSLFGPTSKAYKITVFHNGEASIPGVSSVLNYRNCRSFEQLLRHLTELLHGSVRKIYDAETGGRINNLRQVRDGQNIVVATSMAEVFKRVPYVFPDGRRGGVEQDTPRVVTFFPNGDALHTGQVVTITKKMFPSMQRLLDHLNTKIHMVTGTIHKIYTMTGQRQHTVDDLTSGSDYVVVSNNDAFIAVQYNINALNHLHRTSIVDHAPSTSAVTRRVRKLRKRTKEANLSAQQAVTEHAGSGDESEDQGNEINLTTTVVKRVIKKKKTRAKAHDQTVAPATSSAARASPQAAPLSPQEAEYDDYHRRLPPASTTAVAASAAFGSGAASEMPTSAAPLLVYGPQTREEAGWKAAPEPVPAPFGNAVNPNPSSQVDYQRQIQYHGNPPAAVDSTNDQEGARLSAFMNATEKETHLRSADGIKLSSRETPTKTQKEPRNESEDSEGRGYFTKGKRHIKQRPDEEESAAKVLFTKGKKQPDAVRVTDTESTGRVFGDGTPGAEEAPSGQSTFAFVKKSDTEGYFTKGSQKPTHRTTAPAEVEEVLSLPIDSVATPGPADANEMYGESSAVRVLKSSHPVHGVSSYSSSPSATRRGENENEEEEGEEEVEYETIVTKVPGKKTLKIPRLPRKTANS